VLEGASLAVGDGQFVSLVGPSGSGKSSLLRAVIGLQQPLEGTVEREVAPSDVAILFQDDALLPWKTARDNVALGLTLNGVRRGPALEQADLWLERLGLAGFGHRFPRHLSGASGSAWRSLGARASAEASRWTSPRPLDAIARAHHSDVAVLVDRERTRAARAPRPRGGDQLSDHTHLLSQAARACHADIPTPPRGCGSSPRAHACGICALYEKI
jgi:NitT/TauT family transport system ATP-binding protein